MGAAKRARLAVQRMRIRLQGRRGAVFLVAGGILLGLAVVAVTGLGGWAARARILDDSSREVRNLTLIIASHTDRAFRAVHASLDTLLEGARGTESLGSPEGFAAWASSAAAHGALRDSVRLLPQLEAVAMLAPDGRLLGTSSVWPARASQVLTADQIDYLLTARTDDYVAKPRPTTAGVWVIPIVRRILRADGEPLGIVIAAMRMEYFDRIFGEVGLPVSSSVSLLRRDGVLLARTPALMDALGTNLRSRIREVDGPLPDISYWPDGRPIRAIGPDGVERLYAGQLLTSFPLQLRIGVPMEKVLGVWHEIASRLTLGAILLLLVLAWAVLAALRLFLAEARSAQERLRLQREIALRHDDFRATVEGMSQGVWKFGPDGRLALTNNRCESVIGLPPQMLRPGMTLADLTRAAEAAGAQAALDLVRRLARFVDSRDTASFLHDLPDGRIASVLHRPLADGGWLATFEDVTERHAAEARLRFLARHDALTGLPNRVQLQEHLTEALQAAAPRGRGAPLQTSGIAVLYLDLDRFKHVNDTLGHAVGDALLRSAAGRISGSVRSTRAGGDLVARLGGDEFAVLLRTTAGRGEAVRDDAAAVAARLVEILAQPFTVEGHQVVVGATVGVAVHPADGATPDELLRAADLALYRAKADGRGRHRFFDRAMDEEAQARRAIEAELRAALFDRGGRDFELHYQPVIDIATRRPTGCEALLRWKREGRAGLSSPAEFIPIAEDTDLIVPLGALVLQRACAEAASWPDNSLRLAVNLSPAQFRRPGLVETVSSALAASGLDPRRLEIEVTEGLLLERTEEALGTMHKLRALGVRFAMDDFGTGYSSLAYLRSFPFDRLKIDRAFIRDIEARPGDAAIVRSVAGMCAELGMTTVAEGVETEGQFAILAAARCREAQGYLFGEPVPARELGPALARLGAALRLAAE